MHDPSQDDPAKRRRQWELNYVALDGSIGCMVSTRAWPWAPWTSSTCTAVPGQLPGRRRQRRQERVTEAFKDHPLRQQGVQAVLVSIFGGIVRCDMIAEGIIGAVGKWGESARGGASGRQQRRTGCP